MTHCSSFKWLPSLCTLLIVALVAFPSGVDAQSTVGKISGRVTDAATGEVLPGANIVLEGTRLGATAGVNGEYFILQVSPGMYSVQASIVGYRAVAKTGVEVLIDRTATVDFELGQTDSELDELVVTADLDPVQMDVSFAQQALTQDQIESIPMGPRLRDQVASQVGVDTDAWGITIRGESSTQIGYNMDGIGQTDNRQSRAYTSFSKTAIKQVQILTGGFNAEHGNVSGGVVNFVTKEPTNWFVAADATYNAAGRKHFGPDAYSEENWWDVGRFQSNSPTADTNGDGAPDFIGWDAELAARSPWKGGTSGSDIISTSAQAKGIWDWQHRRFDGLDPHATGGLFNAPASERDSDYMWDATVGGPIVQDKIGFSFSTRKERMAYPFDVSTVSYRDNTTQVKLVLSPTATTKLTTQYIRGYQNGGHQGNNVGSAMRTQQSVFEDLSHQRMFMPSSDYQIMTVRRAHGMVNWSHTLSPKTFYNLTARFGTVDWTASWHPQKMSSAAAVAIGTDGSNTRVDDAGADAARASGAVILSEAPFGWNYKPGGNDILNIFRMQGGGGNSRAGDWSEIWENDFTADVTSQITPNHQIKVGAQIHHFSLHENRGYVPGAVPEYSDAQFRDEYSGPRISATGDTIFPWTGEGSALGDINGDGLLNESDVPVGGATGDHNNYFVKTPVYGGFFFQDRMEYRSIVANAGIRLDFYRPDLYFDLPNETHAAWYGRVAEHLYTRTRLARGPTTYAVSPRFGASYPITTLSKMFINYGHFNQTVNTRDLYRAQSGLGQSLEFLGNPYVKMERTIQYEMGYERSFQRQYLLTGTVYFKDGENKAWTDGRMRLEFGGRSTRFTQNAFATDSRGLELKLQKTRGKFFTGFLSYDVRVARVRNTGWRDIQDKKTTSNPTTNVLEWSPNQAAPPFKAKPQQKLGGNFRTPLDYGDDQALLKGGWNLGFFFEREAGAWFNYNPGNSDASLINTLNAQWVTSYTGHLRISKMFDVQTQPMLYLEITNPLNFKNSHTTPGGAPNDVWGVSAEDTPLSQARSYGGGSAFDSSGPDAGSDGNRFKAYMEGLGWVVDSNGKLAEGKRPGTDLESAPDMRRSYFLYGDRRDITFGARFSF
jgi:hypothetical protein